METKHFTFEDISPHTLKAFISCLYFGTLFDAESPPTGGPGNGDINERTTFPLTPEQIVTIRILGDTMNLVALPRIDIYNNTPAESRLRFYVVDMFDRFDGLALFSSYPSNYMCLDFLLDTCTRAGEIRDKGGLVLMPYSAFPAVNLCPYRIHIKTDCKGSIIKSAAESHKAFKAEEA